MIWRVLQDLRSNPVKKYRSCVAAWEMPAAYNDLVTGFSG